MVQSHLVVEGAAFRKFEGEEDKNHHGKLKNATTSLFVCSTVPCVLGYTSKKNSEDMRVCVCVCVGGAC